MADEQKLKRVCGMHLNGSLSARNTLLSRAGIARFGKTCKQSNNKLSTVISRYAETMDAFHVGPA